MSEIPPKETDMRYSSPCISLVFAVVLMTAVIGVLRAVPLALAQEPGKVYRIGWLGRHFEGEVGEAKPFLEQLGALGWTEGQDLVMQYATSTFKDYKKNGSFFGS